jgi:predicted adenine nucleotide alpha hydrolase (AANH) superfamily ATPase
MKLLLHACCAPCSIHCIKALAAEEIRPDVFWYNPNIHPFTEYRARRDSFLVFANDNKIPVCMEDEYGLRSFIKAVENGAVRCAFCYRLRLEKTVRFAAGNGYNAFSTTLLISPYQNHELIRHIAGELAESYGLEFLYRDFRAYFREGLKQAREAAYYMQKYCGCIYSEEERYLTKQDT